VRIRVSMKPAAAAILAAMPVSADRGRILHGLGAAAMGHWKKLAQQRLTSTSRDYIKGLQFQMSGGKAYVVLTGRLANMVEGGWSGGDMRDWMLSGPKVRMGKNGPYRNIQFQHGTTGTSGRNVGKPMPKPIWSEAAKLSATLSRAGVGVGDGGKTVWGERLHLGMPLKDAARRILQRKEQPWHATSIYDAMVRKGQHEKTGVVTAGYSTWRRISRFKPQGARGKSWMHPGIKPGRELAKEVQKHIEGLASSIVLAATR